MPRNEGQRKYDPRSSEVKVSAIRELIKMSEKYDQNPEKIHRKEICGDHELRKTLYCSDCRKYMCDRCYVMDPTKLPGQPSMNHSEHKTTQISKMAYEVLDLFTIQFKEFSTNITQIQKLAPQDWKLQIRKSLLDFFDQI